MSTIAGPRYAALFHTFQQRERRIHLQLLFVSRGYNFSDIADLDGDGKADVILYNSTNGMPRPGSAIAPEDWRSLR